MSYPSAMPLKATTEASQKTASGGYTLSYHKASPKTKYPFKWTVLGLAIACTGFWVAVSLLV